MKKWAVLISAVGLAFSVSGCSSDYVMATKDGRMILTDGKPAIDDDTGLISYEDQQGNKMQINRDDVSQIINRYDPPTGSDVSFIAGLSSFHYSSDLRKESGHTGSARQD